MDTPSLECQKTALQTFDQLFPTEEASVAFLFPIRWPRGFICPFCHTRHPHLIPQRYLTCAHCGNRTSLTSNTIMHGAKKSVRDWLLAIWWFSGSGFGTSAKELQRLLDISCYQTAWTWLRKLRLVMGRADRTRCHGVVEIGFGTVTPARERNEQALILTGAEIVLSLDITGRIRMHHIARLDEETLSSFLQGTVQSGSTLLSDEQALADMANRCGFYCTVPAQPWSSTRISELNQSFETCLHTVHRGGVTTKYLQLYLDEFCFRNNASLLPDHRAVFKALIAGIFNDPVIPGRSASLMAAGDSRQWRLP